MTTTIGLEIDARSMRLTFLCGLGKRQKIRHGSVELPVGAVIGGTIQQVDTVADALTSLLKSMRVSRGQVVAVLPGDDVSSRIITLPPMSSEQITTALAWSDMVPLSGKSGLVRSHWNLGPDSDKKIRVLAAAVGEETAARLAEAVFLAGFELTALEIAPISVWRLLKKGWLMPAPVKDNAPGFAVLALGEGGGHWMVFRHHQLWEWAHFRIDVQDGCDQKRGKYHVDPGEPCTEDHQERSNDPDDESRVAFSVGEDCAGQFHNSGQDNNHGWVNNQGITFIRQWLSDNVMSQPLGQQSGQPFGNQSGQLLGLQSGPPSVQPSNRPSGQQNLPLNQLLLIGSRATQPGLARTIQEILSLPVTVGGPMDASAALAAGASLRGEF